MSIALNELVYTNNSMLATTTKLIKSTTKKGIFASNVIGYMLYSLELNLTSIVKGGPSTDLMICNKLEGCLYD